MTVSNGIGKKLVEPLRSSIYRHKRLCRYLHCVVVSPVWTRANRPTEARHQSKAVQGVGVGVNMLLRSLKPHYLPWLAKTERTSELHEFNEVWSARVILALWAEYGVSTDICEDLTPWDIRYFTTRNCTRQSEKEENINMARTALRKKNSMFVRLHYCRKSSGDFNFGQKSVENKTARNFKRRDYLQYRTKFLRSSNFAYSCRAWNLNWPIRIHREGKTLLCWVQCKLTRKALKSGNFSHWKLHQIFRERHF